MLLLAKIYSKNASKNFSKLVKRRIWLVIDYSLNFFSPKDKTRVLVTHQLQYLRDVNNIIIMENGKVKTENIQEYLENSLMKNLKEEGFVEDFSSDPVVEKEVNLLPDK